jgi:hypothetical protein
MLRLYPSYVSCEPLAEIELSPAVHPLVGRILKAFELMRLGGATGRGAEPSVQRSRRAQKRDPKGLALTSRRGGCGEQNAHPRTLSVDKPGVLAS